MGHTGRVERERAAVAHLVTLLENGCGQTRISVFKLVHEILLRDVETVATELATRALPNIGERPFQLVAPVATGSIHVLNFPNRTRTVFACFGENVRVVGVEEVLLRGNDFHAQVVASLPIASVGMRFR